MDVSKQVSILQGKFMVLAFPGVILYGIALFAIGALIHTELPVREEVKAACWYGEKEGHMKKAIEKLRKVYPHLAVRCFAGYGHGDIMNHPERLVKELIHFLNWGDAM